MSLEMMLVSLISTALTTVAWWMFGFLHFTKKEPTEPKANETTPASRERMAWERC